MLAFMACDSKKGTSADNAEEETTANELVEEKSEAAASLDAPDAAEIWTSSGKQRYLICFSFSPWGIFGSLGVFI